MHYLSALTRRLFSAPIKTRARIGILGIVLLLFCPSIILAAQVTLAWDACDPQPQGYQLYKRTQNQSYDFNKPAWTGKGNTGIITALADNTQYFFVVRAHEGAVTSDSSNEVGFLTPIANQAPTANAGASRTVTSASFVQLDGTGSFDPEGSPLSYRWVQTAGPVVGLSSATSAKPTFTAPTVPAGGTLTLIFELTVTDNGALTGSDTCMVQVNSIPSQPIDPHPGEGDPVPPPPQQGPIPVQPIIYYPAAGATNVSLAPILTASNFSGENSQWSSQWRIINDNSRKIVLDVTRDYRPTSLWVPLFTLARNTTYSCQVRYFDKYGQASEWSQPVTFTTQRSWFGSSSLRIDEAQLVSAETEGYEQGVTEAVTIQSVQTAQGDHFMAVSVEDCENAQSVDGIAAICPDLMESPPPFQDLQPYGVLSYRIRLEQPGQQAQVTLHLSDPIDPRSAWITYSADGEWVDCSDQIHVKEDGVTVVRTILDGGQDDADGVVNGIIVDLLAPRQALVEQDGLDKGLEQANSMAGDGSSSGGCFIGSLFK